MYFFSNVTWGSCYTVMAENEKEAIKIVKDYLSLSMSNRDPKEEYRECSTIKIKDKYNTGTDDVSIQNCKFEIREFEPGKVLETEYA